MSWQGAVFVGDTHVGGHHALYPAARLPEFPKYPGIRYLADCWHHALDALPRKIPLLVFTGDLIEGTNRKAQSIGLFSARLSDQVEAAIELLAPLARRAETVLRVSGTDYHDDAHNPLLALDIALKVKKARQVFNLDMGTGILNVAHHPKGGGVMYEGTKLDQEQRLMRLAAEAGKVPKARWIVRGHLHNFRHFRTPTSEVVLLPCWKLPDAYAMKGNLFGWQPDLGLVVMDRDRKAASGYLFRENLYDLPKVDIDSEETLHAEGETDAA